MRKPWGAAQELEVLQMAVDLAGVAVERQVPDRHAAIAGDVEAELDGCSRASAIDYAAFLGLFFPDPP